MNGQTWDDIGNDGTAWGRAIKRVSEVPSFAHEVVGGAAMPVGALVGTGGKLLSFGGKTISNVGRGVDTIASAPKLYSSVFSGLKGKIIPGKDKVPTFAKISSL